MKNIGKLLAVALVVLLWLGNVAAVAAEDRPFITTWKGVKGEELRIPIVGKEYKLVIKNDKGQVVKQEEKVTVETLYTFTPPADGVYTVEAGAAGVRYMQMTHQGEASENGSCESLLSVQQFGDVEWTSMRYMFALCENMTFATGVGVPNLTKVRCCMILCVSIDCACPILGSSVDSMVNIFPVDKTLPRACC